MNKIVERINKSNGNGDIFHDSRHDVNTLGKAINIAFDKINEVIDFLATLNTETKKDKDISYMQDSYDCIFMDKDEQILYVSKKNSVAVGEVIQTREEKRYDRYYYKYDTYIIRTTVEKIKQKTDKEIICLCTIEEIKE